MKPTSVFVCSSCDNQSPKWTGQCLECGSWGTLQEQRLRKASPAAGTANAARSGQSDASPEPTTAFEAIPASAEKRIATGLAEADRVFGGGIVAGSVTLLGGEPGIGKSTLSLMIAARVATKDSALKSASGALNAKAAKSTTADRCVLYVSGEESASQVKMRADRLGLAQTGLKFASATDVDRLIATLDAEKPALAIIDSVQMLRSEDIAAEAGAATQVRGAAGRLVAWAKASGIPLLLIGHVTKDGGIAGPKTLEHVVDTVLSFEGERSHPLRVLRALKNRFGSTDETGIFEMTETGLAEIRNPSAYLLEGRAAGSAGSALTCMIEGTRPILVEIQALVQKTSFGYPARKASGFEQGRLEMLLAVLSKRGRIDLSGHDVYLNVAGGMRVREPAADLAVLLALASAFKDQPLPRDLVAWGEIGLGGEVRPVPSGDRRLAEAAALGVTRAVRPTDKRVARDKRPANMTTHDAATVADAIAAAFTKSLTPAPQVHARA